jgi:hypothetical protein
MGGGPFTLLRFAVVGQQLCEHLVLQQNLVDFAAYPRQIGYSWGNRDLLFRRRYRRG